MNLNKVQLIGRLTGDPQLRSTKTGQQVSVFSVATNRVYTDKNNQKQEQVEYHNVVVWGRQAEIVSKFLLKGQLVYIDGRLQSRDYEDKQGVKRRVTEIVAERVQFGPKAGAGGASAGRGPQTDSSVEEKSPLDEIPTINLEDDIKPEDLPF